MFEPSQTPARLPEAVFLAILSCRQHDFMMAEVAASRRMFAESEALSPDHPCAVNQRR
jgi:hypothetical protein